MDDDDEDKEVWRKVLEQASTWETYWYGVNPINQAIAKRMKELAKRKLLEN